MFFNPEAVSQQPLSGSQLEKFSVLLPEHAASLIVTHCMRTLRECLKKQLSDSDTLMGIRRCNNTVYKKANQYCSNGLSCCCHSAQRTIDQTLQC